MADEVTKVEAFEADEAEMIEAAEPAPEIYSRVAMEEPPATETPATETPRTPRQIRMGLPTLPFLGSFRRVKPNNSPDAVEKKKRIWLKLEDCTPEWLEVDFDANTHTLFWKRSVNEPQSQQLANDFVGTLMKKTAIKGSDQDVAATKLQRGFRGSGIWASQHGDLPAGSCCFYLYPSVQHARKRAAKVTGVALKLLEKIICAFAAQEPARFNIVNNVGGYPIHALMICNTDESLDLALRLMQRRAEWLILPYANSPPLHLFTGETILHVAAANDREDIFVRIVEIATRFWQAYEDRTKAGEELEEKEKPVDYITRIIR